MKGVVEMRGFIIVMLLVAVAAVAFYTLTPTPEYQKTTGAFHVDEKLHNAGVVGE